MEVTPSHRQIPVIDPSQVSAARFAARDVAETAGFDGTDAYRAGIVATELASNLIKHSVGGELLVRFVGRTPVAEIEIMSIDRGPGMVDIARSLADGHSTTGTAGTGLGAVRRLADEFDIYSQEGRGTVVLARLRAKRAVNGVPTRIRVAGVSVAKAGEEVCGDAWQAVHHDDGVMVVVVDGLGHGLQADEASSAAIASFNPGHNDLVAHLQAMHDGLRHTRGAAGAVADIRPRLGILKFAGIGNITGSIFGVGAVRHAVSTNGTLGHEARHFREYSYPLDAHAVVVIHSDGLTSHWSLDAHPGLRQHHPAVIAAVLYRDFSRKRDDVTVVVGKEAA